MKTRPRLKNIAKAGFAIAAGTFFLLNASPSKANTAQPSFQKFSPKIELELRKFSPRITNRRIEACKPIEIPKDAPPPILIPKGTSKSILQNTSPIQTPTARLDSTLPANLDSLLKSAFYAQLCQIRADSGCAKMPEMSQTLSKAAQNYADTLATLPAHKISHEYISSDSRFYPLYKDESLQIKNFSIRECIHSHIAAIPFSKGPGGKILFNGDSLKSEIRKSVFSLIHAQSGQAKDFRHKRILLHNPKGDCELLSGIGISIAAEGEMAKIIIVYIKAEAKPPLQPNPTSSR